MANIKRFPVLVLVATLWSSSAYATTPTISGVSGTVSTGQTLTVSGSSMVDENKTNWLAGSGEYINFQTGTAYGFEGSTPLDDDYLAPSSCTQGNGTYVSDVRLMGSKSMRYHVYGAWSGGSGPGDCNYVEVGDVGADLWVRFYVRFELDGGSRPTEHFKLYDIQGGSGEDQMYFQFANGDADSWNAAHSGTNHEFPNPDGTLQYEKWYPVEVRFKTTTPYAMEVYLNGSATPAYSGTPSGTYSNLRHLLGPINWGGTNSDFSWYEWFDAYTISTSRVYLPSKIEISNNATYGSGTVKYQEPVYLSDGSVQIKADLAGLGDGPYYLFVTNNRQERSAAYSLSGGSPPPSSDIVPGNLLFSESFESAISDGVRGWIDGGMSDIVAGGYSGNAMRWSWAELATQPTNSTTIRKALAADQSKLFVRVLVKFDSNWIGSGQAYHPHMLMVLSGADYAEDAYGPLANNYLNTYIEANSETSSPYNITPIFGIQDQQRVNTANGTPPVDLRAVTENRSTGYCNQPVPSGWDGICYSDNPYYSAATVAASSPIPKNEWVTLDTYMEMNTITDGVANADGHVVQWVDGENVSESSDVMFRTNQHPTMGFRQFVFGPWIGDGSPIAQSMYIDELEVYDGYSVGVRGGRFSGSLSGGGVMR